MMRNRASHAPDLQKNVLRLGWISFFNDLSSETLIRLIPIYLASVLGVSMQAIGLIEGLAESISVLLKPVFGEWTDRIGKCKPFILFGYSLSALSRPLMCLASSGGAIAALRFLDRIGKGVRTAPRDALIATSASADQRGRGFGINRALDTFGAVLGVSIFAFWTMQPGHTHLNHPMWVTITLACSIPGFIAVALIAFTVRDSKPHVFNKPHAQKISYEPLSPQFKNYLMAVALFGLANSSDAFILLRAKELGYSLTAILGVVILFNLVSAMTAIPAAALSDRVGRKSLILMGWAIYTMTYMLLGLGVRSPIYLSGILVVYGLFYGFTDGVEKAWVGDLSTDSTRGRAYGIFGMITGLAALPASFLFGLVWDHFGSRTAFSMGALLALGALTVLWVRVSE